MYRHERVMRVRRAAVGVVSKLYEHLVAHPGDMPAEWAAQAEALEKSGVGEARFRRLVCDYIAGMTDRYALEEHRRLFGGAPELRAVM